MFEIAINIFESFITIFVIYILLSNKKRGFRASILITLFAVLQFLFITVINHFTISESLYVIIEYALAFLFASAISKDGIGHRLFASTLPFNVIGIENSLQNMTISYLVYKKIDLILLLTSELRIPIVLLAQAMHVIVFALIVHTFHKLTIEVYEIDYLFMALTLFVCNLMTICFESVAMHFDNQDFYMILGIYSVVLFVVLISFLFRSIYFRSLNESKQQLELDILNAMLSSNEKIMQAQHDLQQLHHDMKHFVRLLREIEESPDQERLRDIIDQYDQTVQDGPIPIKTISPALDYIINIKQDDAVNKGIDYIVSVNLTHPIMMEDDDLCLLLANLLDNAIEHIGIKKRIFIEIRDVNQMFMIRVTNSIDMHALNSNGKIISRFRGDQHGHGIKTIEKVLEKYGGFFSYKENEDNFIATAMLPLAVINPQ